jgi:hypothetical protein
VFFINREKIQNKIDKEKTDEEVIEQARLEKFPQKFPKINKTPIISNFVSWLYKEGWLCIIGLIIILTNFYFISTNNLGTLPLQNDEFLTQGAVKYILEGNLKISDLKYGTDNNAAEYFYSRSLPYSLGVSGITFLLGGDVSSIFNLRFFSIILGILTLFLFYLFLRKNLSRIVSLIVIYFFSTSYIFVYHSRSSRMYSLLLLLFVALLYIFYTLHNRINYLWINEINKAYIQKMVLFIRKNYPLISIFILISIVGLRTHYNVAFIVFPVILYTLFYSKSKENRMLSMCFTLIFTSLIITNNYLYEFFPRFYFNQKGNINLVFIEGLFNNYKSGAITLLFFLIPIAVYKYLPKNIKLSYITFSSIYLFLLCFANGTTFHDARYFIFLFPLYTTIIIYGIYLTIKIIATKQHSKMVVAFLLLILSAMLVGRFQVAKTCTYNPIVTCPISDQTRVFNLDRWNYNYDEMYSVIKDNVDLNTLLVSRTLHKFYTNKYGIPEEMQYSLSDILKGSQQIFSGNLSGRKYGIEDLKNKNIIFVVYPNLIYLNNEVKNYNDIYNYLYFYPEKQLLYKSDDSKTLIYKIGEKQI